MDWGFDLPDGLDGLGDHIFSLDLHHDGIPEVNGGVLDINHDGIPESTSYGIDFDHDGIPDSMNGVLDINHDGIPESTSYGIDINHDGIPEGSMGFDHMDSFLHADHANIESSSLTSAVTSMHFPNPFAGSVVPRRLD